MQKHVYDKKRTINLKNHTLILKKRHIHYTYMYCNLY